MHVIVIRYYTLIFWIYLMCLCAGFTVERRKIVDSSNHWSQCCRHKQGSVVVISKCANIPIKKLLIRLLDTHKKKHGWLPEKKMSSHSQLPGVVTAAECREGGGVGCKKGEGWYRCALQMLHGSVCDLTWPFPLLYWRHNSLSARALSPNRRCSAQVCSYGRRPRLWRLKSI